MKYRIGSLYHVVAAAILVITTSSCDSLTSSSSIDTTSGLPRSQSAEYHDGGNLDQQMSDLVHIIPGFGGAYSNEDGSLTIYLKDAPTRDDADERGVPLRQAAPDVLDALLSNVQRESNQLMRTLRESAGEGMVYVRRGRYDFRELDEWKKSASSLLADPAVAMVDNDEESNSLAIGLTDLGAKDRVLRELIRLGVPAEAFKFEPWGESSAFVTVRDRLRAVRAGSQIRFSYGGLPYYCTNGFNVSVYDRQSGQSHQGFMTNAHCTGNRDQIDGIAFYQNTLNLSSDFVGYETYESRDYSHVPYVYGSSCPPGYRCYFSDVAIVVYPSGVTRDGAVHRAWPEASLNISSANPSIPIHAERARSLSGTRAYKVGRTTGYTEGKVSNTCADIVLSNEGVVMFCQFIASRAKGDSYALALGGDSGSPVFNYGNNNTDLSFANSEGLLWGGTTDGKHFYYTHIQDIRLYSGWNLDFSTAGSAIN